MPSVVQTIALSTGSLYSYGLTRVFELAAEAGFDAVEILVDERWDTRQPAYLRRLSREAGLPIAAIHNPFLPHVPGWPSDPLGRLRLSAQVAREVGAPLVVTHLPLRIRWVRVELVGFKASRLTAPLPLPGESAYRRFLLDGLARFEAEEAVVVAVENMPVKRLLGLELDIHALNRIDFLATLPHLTLDTTHLGTRGLDPVAVYERLKERVAHVHLSDFKETEHLLPGDGHLPLGELLERLARDGYRGVVTVELGPEALHAEDEARVKERLRQAVDFCREHTGR
ncbi:MAG: sugar phosphate isomerase/epimerase [Anaerolineae bacterium]|nr:sugar phosphate isomerase/epimerase [Anaerolineae bacterium]